MKFFDYVRSELGDDPKTQTKVFLISELITNESRYHCGVGGKSVDASRKELCLEDNDEYPAWRLHPGRVYFGDCPECSNPRSVGCPVVKGRDFHFCWKFWYFDRYGAELYREACCSQTGSEGRHQQLHPQPSKGGGPSFCCCYFHLAWRCGNSSGYLRGLGSVPSAGEAGRSL